MNTNLVSSAKASEKQINDVRQNVAYFSAGDVVLELGGGGRLLRRQWWCVRQSGDNANKVSLHSVVEFREMCGESIF